MRIEFKPQTLLKNLVSENISKDGKTASRIIETSGQKPKIIELTYRKSDFLPTEWFVESYNVMTRKRNGSVTKAFHTNKTANNKQILIQNFYNNCIKETTISIKKGSVKKSSKFRTI